MKSKSGPLTRWIISRMSTIHAEKRDYLQGRNDVTVLAYFFLPDTISPSEESEFFRDTECAFRETWLNCGIMPSVIVSNRSIKCVETFAETFSPWVRIDIEPTLVPGKIYTMSADCNSRLHQRFSTPYVLIVQNDGFPLRPGLNDFIGEYDFIGAPYVRDKIYIRLFCKLFGCWVSNGGFSLRSHEICEQASYYWNKKYHTWPDCDNISEDYFYTKTLPLHESAYRKTIKIADCRRGLDFSYDAIVPYTRKTLPFGFHNENSFEILYPLLTKILSCSTTALDN